MLLSLCSPLSDAASALSLKYLAGHKASWRPSERLDISTQFGDGTLAVVLTGTINEPDYFDFSRLVMVASECFEPWGQKCLTEREIIIKDNFPVVSALTNGTEKRSTNLSCSRRMLATRSS